MRFRIVFLLLMATLAFGQKPAPKAAVKTPVTKAATAPKLDRAKLEPYFRHLFVWGPPIELTISDPTPAPMPGYWTLKVTGRQGTGSLTETFYLSQDQQTILRGQVFETAQNPFKSDLDKIKTELQPSIGTPGASVVLVEFSDFQCPFCKEEAQILRANLLKDYPKDVRLYYMNFPLEQIHPWAKPAAMMSRCIFHQEASIFWDFHDWVYDKQAELNLDNFRAKALEFAKTKGLDVDQLAKCYDGKVTEEEVAKTVAMGKELEVQSTPTLFVNGRRLAGSVDWPALKRVIDYEIEYQKTAKNAGENCGCDLRLPTIGFGQPGATPTLPGAPKK